MRSRTENAKRNIIWGFVNKFELIVMPFVCRTVLTHTLGIQYVGLRSLFSSLLSMLSFVELGIGNAIVYSMYKPIALHDDDKVCALLHFYKKCYKTIGFIILSVGLLMMPFLNKLVAGDIPDNINLYLLFVMVLFDTVVGYFCGAYRVSLLMATQRVDVVSYISTALNFVSYFLQITVLLTIRNYYIYMLILPCITCINNGCIVIITKRLYPRYICKGIIEKGELNRIKDNVNGMMFQKVGGIVLSSVDTVVISAFLGLKILGIYNSYYCVIQSITRFLTVINSALIPSVGNSLVKENKEKNYEDLLKFQFMYTWILGWAGSCAICLYQPFMMMWQGEKNMFPFGMVVLLVMYFYIYHMGDISYIYREAAGLWWEGKFVPLISSVINLVLNIILVKVIGLSGILISTILSIVMINCPWGSGILFKYYFKSRDRWLIFLKNVFQYFIQGVISATVTYTFCGLIPKYGIVPFLARLPICIVIPNIILFLLNIRNKQFKISLLFFFRILPENIFFNKLKIRLENRIKEEVENKP